MVFIDESGFMTESIRSHGYSLKGARCYARFNWQIKAGRTNAIGALLGKQLLSVCLTTSSVNGDFFHAWVEQDLLPKLPNNSVLVMDNATFHKRNDTRALIEANGHRLLFLPTYSPDFNPIENFWAYLKNLRNKLRCSVEELFQQPIYA